MKKKGSALVFSVLMLAFFLALSLNIYFVARKKGERAGVKVAGERTTNNIDMASSLGYQELLLAEAFVREGFPYSYDHKAIKDNPTSFDNYYNSSGTPVTSGDGFYLDLSGGTYSDSYPGIQINNFIDFFSANWNFESGGSDSQKLIIGEETDSLGNTKRTWQSAGIEEKRTQVREDSTLKSIGGYTLKSISSNGGTSEVTYEKIVLLDGFTKGSITVDSISFTITVTETFDTATFSDRKIDSFIIKTN